MFVISIVGAVGICWVYGSYPLDQSYWNRSLTLFVDLQASTASSKISSSCWLCDWALTGRLLGLTLFPLAWSAFSFMPCPLIVRVTSEVDRIHRLQSVGHLNPFNVTVNKWNYSVKVLDGSWRLWHCFKFLSGPCTSFLKDWALHGLGCSSSVFTGWIWTINGVPRIRPSVRTGKILELRNSRKLLHGATCGFRGFRMDWKRLLPNVLANYGNSGCSTNLNFICMIYFLNVFIAEPECFWLTQSVTAEFWYLMEKIKETRISCHQIVREHFQE